MRVGATWADACILNMSPRGLMVHTELPPKRGAYAEIRRGKHIIVARVVWSNGRHAGMRAQDHLSIDAIVAGDPTAVPSGRNEDRRATPRPKTHDEHRFHAQALEFMAVAAGGLLATALLAATLFDMLRPFGQIAATLGRASG